MKRGMPDYRVKAPSLQKEKVLQEEVLPLLYNVDFLRSERSMVCLVMSKGGAHIGHFLLYSFTLLTSKPFPFPE